MIATVVIIVIVSADVVDVAVDAVVAVVPDIAVVAVAAIVAVVAHIGVVAAVIPKKLTAKDCQKIVDFFPFNKRLSSKQKRRGVQ